MKDFIAPPLYARAEKGTKTLLASAKPLAAGSGMLYEMSTPPPDESSILGDIDVSGLDQKTYLDAMGLPEVARILESPTSLRETALDHLMLTPGGRILALRAYARSQDPELSQLVEARVWVNVLREDALHMRDSLKTDPVSTDILRRSMERMAEHTGKTWPLYVRLKTFTSPELHAELEAARRQNDPDRINRVHAEIKAMATGFALDLVEHYKKNIAPVIPWDNTNFNADELALISDIRHVTKIKNL